MFIASTPDWFEMKTGKKLVTSSELMFKHYKIKDKGNSWQTHPSTIEEPST